MENEEDRKPKKTEKTPSHARWVARVFLIAMSLSAAMSLCSGAVLEDAGYEVDMIEFVDFEHSPKNLMIRAKRTGRCRGAGRCEAERLRDKYGFRQTLLELIPDRGS